MIEWIFAFKSHIGSIFRFSVRINRLNSVLPMPFHSPYFLLQNSPLSSEHSISTCQNVCVCVLGPLYACWLPFDVYLVSVQVNSSSCFKLQLEVYLENHWTPVTGVCVCLCVWSSISYLINGAALDAVSVYCPNHKHFQRGFFGRSVASMAKPKFSHHCLVHFYAHPRRVVHGGSVKWKKRNFDMIFCKEFFRRNQIQNIRDLDG